MLSTALVKAAGNALEGELLPAAIDFDGTNDYLSRGSDLTGNADGKTFTFSAWLWNSYGAAANQIYHVGGAGVRFRVLVGTGVVQVVAGNSSGTTILNLSATGITASTSTFTHVLISVDLTNPSNRSIYINDQGVTVTNNTYANADIDFTTAPHQLMRSTVIDGKGRLAHLYLDYTYRDLSIEANRRLFITADRKPVPKEELAALNPILYLPMGDPTQPGLNLGTGGDFALTGVVARSGRGPNQYNAAYSDLDGSADFLSRTTVPTGLVDGKQFTFQCVFSTDTLGAGMLVSFSSSTSLRFYITTTAGGALQGYGATSVPGAAFQFDTAAATIAAGRNYIVTISLDLTNAANRSVCINGSAVSVTWSSYNNVDIDFSIASTPQYRIGANAASGYFNGRLGDVFFHTSYIDLSVPANLEKFVTGTGIDAKPVDLGANGELPFGTPPLIYLPMYGNNAGKNYGTGGDFTVNSGPFPGARGPNEFWGNKADFDGTTGYLARTSALTGVSNGKTFSFSFFVNFDVLDDYVMRITNGTSECVSIYYTGGTSFRFVAADLSGTTVISNTGSIVGFAAGSWYHVCGCFDTTSSSLRFVYINNIAASNGWTVSPSGQTIKFDGDRVTVGARYSGSYSSFLDGKLSEFYFTTEYIDFSQESNRLKFRDAFGNPVDLTPQIEAGEIPNPTIYMRFDPENFGKNSGTGGDFTVNGTITDGGQL